MEKTRIYDCIYIYPLVRLLGSLSAPQTVKQMWPYICQFVEKLLHEAIEPAVKASDPHLSTFCFSKINIGDKVSERAGQLSARVGHK